MVLPLFVPIVAFLSGIGGTVLFGAITALLVAIFTWVAWIIFKSFVVQVLAFLLVAVAAWFLYKNVMKADIGALDNRKVALMIGIPLVLVIFGVGLLKFPIIASFVPASMAQAVPAAAFSSLAGEAASPAASAGVSLGLEGTVWVTATIALFAFLGYAVSKE